MSVPGIAGAKAVHLIGAFVRVLPTLAATPKAVKAHQKSSIGTEVVIQRVDTVYPVESSQN